MQVQMGTSERNAKGNHLGKTSYSYYALFNYHDLPISNKTPVFHSPCNKKTKTVQNYIFFGTKLL